MIEKVIEFLREHLFNSHNVSSGEIKYRYLHSIRVGKIARMIAIKENANVKICTIAGLLHDVGKFDTEIEAEHARVSAKVARGFLETLPLSVKEIDDICYAIACHYDGNAGYEYEKTLEAEIVSDADNIDRFDILRAVNVAADLEKEAEGELNIYIDLINKRRNKIKKYLETMTLSTPTSTMMFKDNLKKFLYILDNLLVQISNSNTADLS